MKRFAVWAWWALVVAWLLVVAVVLFASDASGC
jgi:hypothetical protein